MSDVEDRRQHAGILVEQLFPGCRATFSGRRGVAAATREFGFAPSYRHPRLLVPVGPREAAATALRVYGGRLSRQARWGYRGAAGALRLTGPVMLPHRLSVTGDGREPGIDDHLSRIFGQPVSVAVHLTPARANRKPIVQALGTGRSTPLGFAKVATNDLTRSLLDAEGAVLRELAEHPPVGIQLPSVVGQDLLGELPVLTLSALPTWSAGRLPTRTELVRASLAVADSAPRTTQPLAGSRYWSRLTGSLAGLSEDAAGGRLRRIAERMAERWGDLQLDFGRGHGDWSPWNMWQTSQNLLVWDWERSAEDLPVGSDLTHYALQEMLTMHDIPPARAAQSVLDLAHRQLAGAVPAEAAPAVAATHLLSLAVRYERDGQAAAGSPLGRTEQWLLPALDGHLRGHPGAGR